MKALLGGAILALSMAAGAASAATITSSDALGLSGNDGNDCSGYFGTGFDNCVFDYGDYDTAVIAKIDWENSSDDDQNSNYGTIDGSELAITDSVGSDGWYNVTYTLGVGDPTMTVFIVKAGTGWTAYDSTYVDDTQGWFEFSSGVYTLYFTESNVSHVTVYNGAEIPLPAAGFLLLGGLGGLAMLRRRKT